MKFIKLKKGRVMALHFYDTDKYVDAILYAIVPKNITNIQKVVDEVKEKLDDEVEGWNLDDIVEELEKNYNFEFVEIKSDGYFDILI